MPKKRGRRDKWASGLGDEFVAAVDAIEAERRHGIVDAIGILKKRQPRKWPQSVASLETRYHEHQQRIVTARCVAEILRRLEVDDVK